MIFSIVVIVITLFLIGWVLGWVIVTFPKHTSFIKKDSPASPKHNILKVLWYGMFIDYHTRKRLKVDKRYFTLYRYHYEMACHYYYKAYGKHFEGD